MSNNGKTPMQYRFRNFRCRGTKHNPCSRLLFRAIIVDGCVVEVRCPKCGKMNVIGRDALPEEEDIDERASEAEAVHK